MGLIKRIAGILGLGREDGAGAHEVVKDLQEEGEGEGESSKQEGRSASRPNFQETGLPRKGFAVPVQVTVDRPHLPPLLVHCSSGDGGVQGLRWYAKRLRVDEDGDVADEFLEEVLSEASSSIDVQQKPSPRFQVKCRSRPAKIRNQMMSVDGRIQQCVEHEGKLQWV